MGDWMQLTLIFTLVGFEFDVLAKGGGGLSSNDGAVEAMLVIAFLLHLTCVIVVLCIMFGDLKGNFAATIALIVMLFVAGKFITIHVDFFILRRFATLKKIFYLNNWFSLLFRYFVLLTVLNENMLKYLGHAHLWIAALIISHEKHMVCKHNIMHMVNMIYIFVRSQFCTIKRNRG